MRQLVASQCALQRLKIASMIEIEQYYHLTVLVERFVVSGCHQYKLAD